MTRSSFYASQDGRLKKHRKKLGKKHEKSLFQPCIQSHVYTECHGGQILAFVDIKTKVPLQYRLLILKHNFQYDVNKS